MHLFRSEEHVRNWSGFASGTGEAILPVAAIMELLSTPRHSAKLNGRYVSSAPEYASAFVQKLKEVAADSEFWRPKQ
jgi:hypothetical protein